MGTPREAPPAKLFMAVMHRPDWDPASLLEELSARHGAIDARCPSFPFEGSRYYQGEMGSGLAKFFVSFAGTFPQEALADVKLATNASEKLLSDARGRACNLDPGILTHYAVILATTKGHAHRIYLGRGIYAESTLLYRRGGFEPLPWTYPDYRRVDILEYFNRARLILHGSSSLQKQGPVKCGINKDS